jgi:hypothetical protein
MQYMGFTILKIKRNCCDRKRTFDLTGRGKTLLEAR